MIGVDTNPDLLAGIETDASGNPVGKITIDLPRVMDAVEGKREADIFLAAKRLVDIAVAKEKPLVIEDLRFGKKTKRPKGQRRNRGFNRMRCGWAYRKLLSAIERRAIKLGVPVLKVPPGYTSVLGLAKFARSHNLNRHHAAALAIARRGQADTEREATPPPRKQPAPVPNHRETPTVRLTERSYLRLRSQYLRGAERPPVPKSKTSVQVPVEVLTTAGLHGPPSRTGLKTRRHGQIGRQRGTRQEADRSSFRHGLPVGRGPLHSALHGVNQ